MRRCVERKEELSWKRNALPRWAVGNGDPPTDTVTWSEECTASWAATLALPAISYEDHHTLYTDGGVGELLKAGVERALQRGTTVRVGTADDPSGSGRLVWTRRSRRSDQRQTGRVLKLRGTIAGHLLSASRQKQDLQRAMAEVERAEKPATGRKYLPAVKRDQTGTQFRTRSVGRSDATKYVLFKIETGVAPTDTDGAHYRMKPAPGKELVAHAIHSASTRRDRPLVKVNCAALTRP